MQVIKNMYLNRFIYYFFRRVTILLTILLAITLNEFGQKSNKTNALIKDEQLIKQTENEWLNTYLTGDHQVFSRIVAEDYAGTDETGTVRTKNEERKLIQPIPPSLKATLTMEDLNIRIYENTSVVTGKIISKSQGKLNFQSRFTDTFVKRRGRWQVIARHYSRIPAERTVAIIDLKNFQDYAGKYELAPGLEMKVFIETDKLYCQVTGQSKQELQPESEIEFFIKGNNGQFLFVRNITGQVIKLIINQEGQRIFAKKLN